ncbi:D-alanyl-D-alanine carboxypeptidase family protein [Clostridium psychrophilum]|uniref:D-alanyl-D-alanine carboxypeptidase family protein n=1 Tax=Clostridium psychrophilum TaxID=132926 RepID=UPI001C0D6AA6|nr:D-alanyl-D-alanine carboxypeptidase family protein [Clostridium psychrophilum]MBU3181529.1 D-alanyl-D-alanine carboxypeptidase [Clostridium psychrophilum]
MKRRKGLFLLALAFTAIFSTTVFADVKPPDLIGKAAISVDMDTNEIIYTKNIDNKMYPASITKLVTALLLAENRKSTDDLVYTKNAKSQPPYSYNLNVQPIAIGDTMSADNVMDGLLLYSGNDIAYMVADGVGSNPVNFAKMMNSKAAKLGMKNSHFVTPNGVNDTNYTTPYDLSLLGIAAFKNDRVRESMGKKTSLIKSTNGAPATVSNRNKLLGTDGNIGGKTGYTSKAGRCLLSIYERNGRHIIGVVMDSEYNLPKDTKVFEDMTELINFSYATKKKVLHKKNTSIKTISVPYKVLPFIGPEKTVTIPLESKEDVTTYNNDLKPLISLKVDGIKPWKLNKDTSVGTINIKQKNSGKSYKLYPMISKSTLIKDNIIIYAAAIIVLILVIGLIMFLINKINKRRNHRGRRIRF